MVLTINREAERCKLLIERRPSRTTCGMEAKFESKSTSWETFRAASLPEAIATLQSASFSASTSLTPSPVIATVCFFFCRACTICFFCWGDTRPNTAYRSTASSMSSWVCRVVASTYRSASGSSTRLAMVDTVMGLSPEMTLRVTPCSAKYRRVSLASGRITS